MFEFHGWARICFPDVERITDSNPLGNNGSEFEAMKRLRTALNKAHDERCLFELRQAGLWQNVLIVHGLRNHLYEPVIDLFRWIAAELPDSYGLLYIRDAEADVYDANEFRVWRLANGSLEERDDLFLLP